MIVDNIHFILHYESRIQDSNIWIRCQVKDKQIIWDRFKNTRNVPGSHSDNEADRRPFPPASSHHLDIHLLEEIQVPRPSAYFIAYVCYVIPSNPSSASPQMLLLLLFSAAFCLSLWASMVSQLQREESMQSLFISIYHDTSKQCPSQWHYLILMLYTVYSFVSLITWLTMIKDALKFILPVCGPAFWKFQLCPDVFLPSLLLDTHKGK